VPGPALACRDHRFSPRSWDPAAFDHTFLDPELVGIGLVGMTLKESHHDLA
jgi:hypothetical protein